MSIIRVNKNKENPYVMLNKTALNDENLSFKAKGLFAYLMSKPNNWCSNVEHLAKVSKDGRDSVRSALKELREYGYILKGQERNSDGTFSWYEVIYEEPQVEAKEIYQAQKIIADNAAIKRAETIKRKREEHNSNPEIIEGNEPYTENPYMDKNDSTIYGFSDYGKPVDIINNELINNYSSSSKEKTDLLINLFNKNIFELKPVTKNKFIEAVKDLNEDFIIELINYCSESNIKTYAGFNKILVSYIDKGINTREDMLTDIAKYRTERSQNAFNPIGRVNTPKTKNKRNTGDNTLKFNNFTAREYDYDDLEKKLLGWD